MTSHNCAYVTDGAEQLRVVLLPHYSVLHYTGSALMSKKKELSVKKKVAVVNALNDDQKNASIQNGVTSAKRFRLCEKTDIDEALLQWFQGQSQIRTPISGPISKINAEQFATMLGYTDFTCTTGWVDRFKARHNIFSGRLCGEARQQYNNDGIFNRDETGVFYGLGPKQTLKFKGEKCIGGNHSKSRVTVFLCANMTVELSIEKEEQKNIIASGQLHSALHKLSIEQHIERSSATIGPRHNLILFILDGVSNDFGAESLLQAIRLLYDAWESVTPECMKNCFKKVKLTNDIYCNDENDLPLTMWLRRESISQFDEISELDDNVDINAAVITSDVSTMDGIVNDIHCAKQEDSDDSDANTTTVETTPLKT
ncbi:Tigger transposable element-derived protein 4 [Trichinella zimbabwensis]|uniref:Tigger transposable element-derived protein 4 n=1 Tax=Trichinella zimbabwensis TaxID=268475 RepID=A0A0V1GTS0_9BILA|nr:Tigger transposable element-derived protein 4 [Trichinella zimbabwensis]